MTMQEFLIINVICSKITKFFLFIFHMLYSWEDVCIFIIYLMQGLTFPRYKYGWFWQNSTKMSYNYIEMLKEISKKCVDINQHLRKI